MSLRRNIIANYASQVYVTLIGIVMVPLYIRYLGAEAYGLVGFFATLQAWFTLLDMGLTPTISREAARYTGGATDARDFRQLMRTLEAVFVAAATVGGSALFAASGYIGTHWLQASKLPLTEVTLSVKLMAITIAMRWMCGLYRGAITGWERLTWLSAYNSVIATLRFVLVLPVILLVKPTPTVFFGFQLLVAAVELAGLTAFAYQILPGIRTQRWLPSGPATLKPVLKFSLSIAFTSSIWILITQTDKLILSKILPLADYGYFTVGVLVAGAITMISGPISTAIMPRMAKLEACGDEDQLLLLYRNATQLVAVLAGSLAVTMAFGAEPLIRIWTGNEELAKHAAPILRLYALGNGILTLAAFPYYLQYAKGDMRLHLAGNVAFVCLLVPAMIWATAHYGGVGAGYAWLYMNLISFVLWSPIVHRRFSRGLNRVWYRQDVLAIVVPITIIGFFASRMFVSDGSRWVAFTHMSFNGAVALLTGLAASSVVRARAGVWLNLQRRR